MLAVATSLVAAEAASAITCLDGVSPKDMVSTGTLRKLNAEEARLGPRPTGGTAHRRYVNAIERRLKRIDGLRLKSLNYRIKRWDERRTALRVGNVSLPVAGPVPYSKSTGSRGRSAPLTYIPRGTPITAANASGRIVVRDSLPGLAPLAVFGREFFGTWTYDPDGTIKGSDLYERDFLSSASLRDDVIAAGRARAAGMVLLKDRPRSQLKGFYSPYEGVHWNVPGVFLGADEAQRVRDALQTGTPTARITVNARSRRATTRTILATLPGKSREKIVVESHTDGMNAVWDNGPVAMIAMARYLARLPLDCRRRTIQFAFVTGHLYQRLKRGERDGGAEQVAKRLDREYDRGRVAGVVVLEHLGAREYAYAPRPGRPGRVLKRSGRSELVLTLISESTKLERAVRQVVRRHDLRRTALLAGAEPANNSRVPPRCSFGGEGTPYNHHLLPTVAMIAAPQILFSPPFGLNSIDFRLMRRQMLAFTDLTRRLDRMRLADIAGRVLEYRRQRRAGKPTCPEST